MSFIKYLVDEINEARTDPSVYAVKVIKYTAYFDENILKNPDTKCEIETIEGAAAYEECADYLGKLELALDAVEPSKGLTKVANDFLNEALKLDPSEFRTIDTQKILLKYGNFLGKFVKLIELGGTTPEEVVVNLLVGDGEKSRYQREALLNPKLIKIGIASGEHEYGNLTIIILSTDFKNYVDADDTEDYEGPNAGPAYNPKFGDDGK